MLSNAMVMPTLTVKDINKAKKFYQDTLGFKMVAEDPSPGMTFQASQGNWIYIYSQTSSTIKCDHTVASFLVDNIESEVSNLKSKDVKFEDYDMPQMKIKTVNSIATFADMKGAWFRDPDGNILGIMELSPAMKRSMMGTKQQVGAPSR